MVQVLLGLLGVSVVSNNGPSHHSSTYAFHSTDNELLSVFVLKDIIIEGLDYYVFCSESLHLRNVCHMKKRETGG
jgi:hypothetical protein